jgi:predicted nucleic acid-binding protein
VARVFVDTNVLFPFSVMDLMLALTEDAAHEVLWSEALLTEWERVIVREQRRSAASAASITAAIREYFSDSEVREPDYVGMIEDMPGNDPDDRLHMAAAIAGPQHTWGDFVQPLTEQQIRRSMINCSRGEATNMTLPRDFAILDWDRLDFLGWRDPKAPLRGYVVTWTDGGPVGMQLRAAESTTRRRMTAMCQLCRSSRSADTVSLFTARRVGQAGRDGNTIGTYVCTDLTCSHNVRVETPSATLQPDPGRSLEERIVGLRNRLDAFIDEVLRT